MKHSAEYWEGYARTKSRQRLRSTVFADGMDKSERRGNRHQRTQREVEEALVTQDLIEEEVFDEVEED